MDAREEDTAGQEEWTQEMQREKKRKMRKSTFEQSGQEDEDPGGERVDVTGEDWERELKREETKRPRWRRL
jgi:hypothetical protein